MLNLPENWMDQNEIPRGLSSKVTGNDECLVQIQIY